MRARGKARLSTDGRPSAASASRDRRSRRFRSPPRSRTVAPGAPSDSPRRADLIGKRSGNVPSAGSSGMATRRGYVCTRRPRPGRAASPPAPGMGCGCRITQQLRGPAAALSSGSSRSGSLWSDRNVYELPVRPAHRQAGGLEAANLSDRLRPCLRSSSRAPARLERASSRRRGSPSPNQRRSVGVALYSGPAVTGFFSWDLPAPPGRTSTSRSRRHAAHHERPPGRLRFMARDLDVPGPPSQSTAALPYHSPMRRRLVFAAIALPLSVASPACRRGPAGRAATAPPGAGGTGRHAAAERLADRAGRASRARSATCRSNMVWSPDGRYLLITNNGWSKPS